MPALVTDNSSQNQEPDGLWPLLGSLHIPRRGHPWPYMPFSSRLGRLLFSLLFPSPGSGADRGLCDVGTTGTASCKPPKLMLSPPSIIRMEKKGLDTPTSQHDFLGTPFSPCDQFCYPPPALRSLDSRQYEDKRVKPPSPLKAQGKKAPLDQVVRPFCCCICPPNLQAGAGMGWRVLTSCKQRESSCLRRICDCPI